MKKEITNATESTSIAKINDVEILVYENGEPMVPIKPICEVLGVNFSTQLEKIKSDEILGSSVPLVGIVAADGRERKMASLPLKFTFGWLFTINPKNVNEAAREKLIEYKLKCYDVLYDHFVGAKQFLEVKEKATNELIDQVRARKAEFSSAKEKLRETEKQLEELSKQTYQEYLENNRQLTFNFNQETEE